MRLDLYLAEQGSAQSRAQAQALIKDGAVTVNGKEAQKPSQDITATDLVEVAQSRLTRYVTRGGLKLEAALSAFALSPQGQVCADIGASGGGFTDCLLRHGARSVYAIDSGTAQLHPTLREDARVVCMEKCNARYLTKSDFSPQPTFAVMDVSFISQTLLLPTLADVLPTDAVLISLVKPQFEVGRAALGKGGIVKQEKDRKAAIARVKETASALGFRCVGQIVSPIQGGDGNIEYLLGFIKQLGKED